MFIALIARQRVDVASLLETDRLAESRLRTRIRVGERKEKSTDLFFSSFCFWCVIEKP